MGQRPTSLSPGASDEAACIARVFDSFRRIVQALREASQLTEKRLGISMAQLFALQKLAEAQPLCINELADRTFTHQSSVSVVVRRLTERGFVSHSPAPQDARRAELRVTAAGADVLRRGSEFPQQRLLTGLLALEIKQRCQLADLLELLLQRALTNTGTAPQMFFENEDTSPGGNAAG